MKTPERFNNAMSALVKGFFNETLAKSTCAACACGNIIHYSNNVEIPKNVWFENDLLHRKLADSSGYSWWGDYKSDYNRSGYSKVELKEVEEAFETNTQISWTTYQTRTKEEIMNQYYRDGYLAHQTGKSIEDCPTYLTIAKKAKWYIGWQDALEDVANESNRLYQKNLAETLCHNLKIDEDTLELF